MSPASRDRLFAAAFGGAALLCGGAVLLVVLFLAGEAVPALRPERVASLLGDSRWQPGSARDPQFGALPMLAATGLVAVLALVLAGPLGILGAVFHSFYLPSRFGAWNRRLLELLAGVPSVVFGFWGLSVVVPAVRLLGGPGQSLLAAGIVLALMVLPTIALTSQAAFAALPAPQLEGAAALGLGRWATVLRVALPSARRGVLAGIGLAFARAVGETMAVVMVCGNIATFPRSLLDPVRPVTATLALEIGYAEGGHRAALHALALALVLATTGLALVGATRRSREEVRP
jgi:phosphate transport system permease protein